jgi:hypothetical protein
VPPQRERSAASSTVNEELARFRNQTLDREEDLAMLHEQNAVAQRMFEERSVSANASSFHRLADAASGTAGFARWRRSWPNGRASA